MTNLLDPADRPPMEDTQVAVVKPEAGKAPEPPKAPMAPKAPKVGRAPGRANGCLGAIFNLLALLFVLLTCLSAGGLAVLFQYPGVLGFVRGGSAFIPATDAAIAQVLSTLAPPAGTPGASIPTLPPAWTPTDTPTITLTPGPGTPSAEPSTTAAVPTYTATPTATPTRTATKPSPTPTKTGPTPTPTITRSAFAYTMKNGSPSASYNNLGEPCAWLIVGKALGLDGNPMIGLTVHLEGNGKIWDAVTGNGPKAFPLGYMIQQLDQARDTTDVYRIQLLNATGTKLSDSFSLQTYGDCNKTLLRVDFVRNH